jgi:hypothetical protein
LESKCTYDIIYIYIYYNSIINVLLVLYIKDFVFGCELSYIYRKGEKKTTTTNKGETLNTNNTEKKRKEKKRKEKKTKDWIPFV